jgi:amino-acid N-acetyltransferase
LDRAGRNGKRRSGREDARGIAGVARSAASRAAVGYSGDTMDPHDEHDATETLPLLIGPAPFNAHAGIVDLLEQAGLPVPDGDDGPVQMMAAFAGSHLVGCVGWEQYGQAALLRSLVVHPAVRGEGVGTALVGALLDIARAFEVLEVYLLTNDAAGFFSRHDFEVVDRSAVPDVVTASKEFSLNCCATATAMRLQWSADAD